MYMQLYIPHNLSSCVATRSRMRVYFCCMAGSFEILNAVFINWDISNFYHPITECKCLWNFAEKEIGTIYPICDLDEHAHAVSAKNFKWRN